MIKTFVATKEGQGKRKNDFSFTNEGEFVKFGLECDGESVDGGCGCKRSVVGFDTSKATTTFKVVEKEITKEEFIKLYSESERKAGWNFEDEEMLEFANELLEMANSFPVNVILEKRGNVINIRNIN